LTGLISPTPIRNGSGSGRMRDTRFAQSAD